MGTQEKESTVSELKGIILKEDEVLIRVRPHVYDTSKGAHGCLVPHENGMPCSRCAVCDKPVAWDEWESGCE